jgi:bifunctional non-homologous end joining protein LigD
VRRELSRHGRAREAARRSGSQVRSVASARNPPDPPDLRAVVEQLSDLEKARRDGLLVLPDGDQLKVTNLQKVFWPKQKLTKGDLFRYYVRVAPALLPAIADRPLVMKRFPNGVPLSRSISTAQPGVPPGGAIGGR